MSLHSWMSSALKGLLPRDFRTAARRPPRPRFRPLVEMLEMRDLPTVFTVNPLPGNLTGDINNQFLSVNFRKAAAGYFSGVGDAIYRVDQIFSLDPNDPTIIASATDPLPSVGINYKDNGQAAIPGYPAAAARDVGQSSLQMIVQTGPQNPGNPNSGSFNDNAVDNEWALQATGYIFVNAAQAAASRANPWTFTTNSDDESRLIMGANGQTVLGWYSCCGPQLNQVIFNGAGYYPINYSYDQGGGGSFAALYYNAGPAFGDGKNHVIGDTLFNIDVTGRTKLGYYGAVITNVTPDPAGVVGANPGEAVTFTKGASPVTTLAQASALATGGGIAVATDTPATLNYLDTPLVAGTYNGPLTLNNVGAPADVGTPPLTAVSGAFNTNAEDDNFVMTANGFMQINSPGVWTFLVRSSNGEQFQIGPANGTMQTVTMTDGRRLIYPTPVNSSPGFQAATSSGAYNDFGEVNFTAPGLYHFTITWFQSTGTGAMLQWLAEAPGQQTFALVGDSAANGNQLTVFQTELPVADLAVTVTGPSRFVQGGNLTYTITVTNNGPDPAQNVVMKDQLPAGTTLLSFVQVSGPPFQLVGANGSVSATIGSMTSGASAVFHATVRVDIFPAGGVLTNTATVSSDQPPTPGGALDSKPANNTSTLTTTIVIPPPPFYATGADAGALSQVNVYSSANGVLVGSFLAFGPTFRGGVRVTVADLNGDGQYEIVAVPGPVSAPVVEIFSPTGQLLNSFFAITGVGGLPPGKSASGTPSAQGNVATFGVWTGGLFVAAGDINAVGYQDIIIGADAGGGPEVQVFDGQNLTLVTSFFAFPPGFTGGVRVAAGDINGDGKADIITGAGPGAGPLVVVYDANSLTIIEAFYATVPTFRGGIYVAAGDLFGNGQTEIICGAGAGGGPLVTIFSGTTLINEFYAFPTSFHGGVRVSTRDINGDGRADILASAGKGGQPVTIAFDASSLSFLYSFFAYNPLFAGGMFIG